MKNSWLVNEIDRVTREVFTTMLGMDVGVGEAEVERDAPGPTDGVVALVGLTGAWVGIGSLACSAATACRLSSRLLMTEIDAVNEEVLDAIAELANMIVGGFKTSAEQRFGPMGLSIPSVVYGYNFTTRTKGTSEWTRIPFSCEDGKFDVHICLRPGDAPPKGDGQARVSRLQSVMARDAHPDFV